MRRQTSKDCVHTQADLELALARGDGRDPVAAAQLLALDLQLEARSRSAAARRATCVRAKSQKKASTATAPRKNGHDGGPPGKRSEQQPEAGDDRRGRPTPATTKAGAAQPPSVRPVDVRRDCGPGSRPGGKWGWPSRATAIERA